MKIRIEFFCVLFLFGATTRYIFGQNTALSGFSDARAVEEQAMERKFDLYLHPGDLRQWMKRLTAWPHHLGSAYGKENAEFLASQFKQWGFETAIEEFRVLFPTPKTRVLEMTGPEKFAASLIEPPLTEDATSGQAAEQLPTYNAYSIDGDVTGEIVYVNYGIPADYDELAMRGIDVKGKIVLARYGGSWRGIKPKVAAEHGAIGCIIYSDPRDDGYYEGDTYPKGAFRSEQGVQRGSVMDMPLHPGDPLTPFVGATKNANRLLLKDAPTLTKIPVMPISFRDALPILKSLTGPVAPESWRGALPITYHIGPGSAVVRMKLEFNWNQVPLYNVIARLRGNERPDQWIIRGNHHDAWVNGAEDPVSGLVALMAEAQAVGKLAREGWKPKRTIIYAAWDGEEEGLLGSTEWVETHADELLKKAAAYVNSDGNGRGFLTLSGSHSLEKFMNEVGRDVPDPTKNMSALARTRAERMVYGTTEQRKEARERSDLRLHALGSGSDYTPFLQHLGISSFDIRFSGEHDGGSYHSIYDSFNHYTRFGDPTFAYGVALAQVGGRTVMRFADADILPFNFINLEETISKYIEELQKLENDLREDTEEQNRLIADSTLLAAADPGKTYVMPPKKEAVPHLNFAPLLNAHDRMKESASGFAEALKSVNDLSKLSMKQQSSLDEILMTTERALTRKQGLPRRPWFRHLIYAPGFYTGYGVKTLPGVREAIEQRNWKEVEEQIKILEEVIENFSHAVDHARGVLQSSVRN